ncbi:MAG: hypothetical protein ABIG30_03690 [Candidatus Aenigmatarchaeota archaeon]
MTIPDAYQELCNNWMYMRDPGDEKWILPLPRSKIPCRHLDNQDRKCRVHDIAQFVACIPYPENTLVLPIPKGKDSEKDRAFVESMECLHDVSIPAKRAEKIKEMCKLLTDEITLTGRLLNSPHQPISKDNYEAVEKELKGRIGFFNRSEAIENLRANMNMHEIQERYMELFNITFPDYTLEI